MLSSSLVVVEPVSASLRLSAGRRNAVHRHISRSHPRAEDALRPRLDDGARLYGGPLFNGRCWSAVLYPLDVLRSGRPLAPDGRAGGHLT